VRARDSRAAAKRVNWVNRGLTPIYPWARATALRPPRVLALLALLCTFAAATASAADKILRVAVTGDYPPLCARTENGDYAGLDPDVARAFAAERGYAIEWVPVSWPGLAAALAVDRFDVAMTGVTVRADRSIAGRFSLPIAESGAVVLVRDPELASEEALARPGTPLTVNAGGHLERVARDRFPHAAIAALPDNAAVQEAFVSGAARAVVTDTLEAPHWRARARDSAQVGPLTRDVKAYWLPADRAALAAELDAWLLAREADGALARLRMQHLGAEAAQRRPALPALALIAALAERLALMPEVAASKRASGAPVLVPEREAALLAAAVSEAREAARREGLAAPEPRALEAFFSALFEASRAVQTALLAAPPALGENRRTYELDTELRPAIARVTDRIAALLPRLPIRLAENALAEELAARTTGLPGFGEAERGRLVAALAELASARRNR
jgi:cyclohexadienyl dehydratase